MKEHSKARKTMTGKNENKKKSSGNYERKILFYMLLGGLPALLSLIILHSLESPSGFLTILLILISFIAWISLAIVAKKQIFYPLYTISNLLASLREGDYSLRGTGWDQKDGYGDIIREINVLSETLRIQRVEAEEALALLKKVLSFINVSVFAFNENLQLKFLNPAAEKLLGKPASFFTGKTAMQMGIGQYIDEPGIQTVKQGFGNKHGHWQIVHQHFRDEGKSSHLLVISDISYALRGEERNAWKNLIRVLGHELNNSLTPIQSIAATLKKRLHRDGPEGIKVEDFTSGLTVINARADALGRFVAAYSKLAKLPEPDKKLTDLNVLLLNIIDMKLTEKLTILPGPGVKFLVDPDQLTQLLINLIRNACDAMDDKEGDIEIAWREDNGRLHIIIRDQGCGISNVENLFVPFYTTKENGSGIGLVLSRHIAEAHNGQLLLKNRIDQSGCEARLILPLET